MEELSNVRRKTQKAKQLLADKRGMELLMQHPQTLKPLPSMATDPYGTPSGVKMKGGAMKQTEKDMEDERLAMEIKGLKNKTKKMRGGFGPTAFQPQGMQITVQPNSPITPGGIPSDVSGLPDQAPASFKRNTVGMGKKKMLGEDMAGTYKGGAACGCDGGSNGRIVGGARAMRGAAIAKLMKEKGLKLGEASKMLKEMSK